MNDLTVLADPLSLIRKDDVTASAADVTVTACVSVELVIALTADQTIVPREAADRVISRFPIDDIRGRRATEVVAFRGADDQFRECPGEPGRAREQV